MKELSIEEKAKRYDEALEIAKGLYAKDAPDSLHLERMFPSLKESEDEKIRKSLLEYLQTLPNHYAHSGVCAPEWIAWLEKQCEQKHTVSQFTPEQASVLDKHIDKFVKQKPFNNIEPIFNIGDKIQYLKGCGTIMTIEKIENGEYVFANNMGHTTIEDGNKWYLVEQKPTEEYNITGVGSKNAEGKLAEMIKELKPLDAILEKQDEQKPVEPQQDMLSQEKYAKAVDECIYGERKPTWSEEDEKMLGVAISDTFGNGHISVSDWLKSLKDRYTWKPSDEQMNALEHFVRSVGESGYASPYDNNTKLLYSLLSDLKKLREE